MSATPTAQPDAPASSNYRFVVIAAMMVPHVFGFILLESLGLMLPSINKEFSLTATGGGNPRFSAQELA